MTTTYEEYYRKNRLFLINQFLRICSVVETFYALGGIGQANCGHSEDVGVGCQGPDTSRRCIRTCPRGFFKSKNVCKKCSANCRACLGIADNCTECSPTLFLEGTKCVSKCTLGRYGDTTLGKCLPCNANCQTCIDGTRDDFCKTCAEGFVLSE